MGHIVEYERGSVQIEHPCGRRPDWRVNRVPGNRRGADSESPDARWLPVHPSVLFPNPRLRRASVSQTNLDFLLALSRIPRSMTGVDENLSERSRKETALEKIQRSVRHIRVSLPCIGRRMWGSIFHMMWCHGRNESKSSPSHIPLARSSTRNREDISEK
jgi:hypothetical protein